jgi:hypothetical protein
MSVLNIPGTLSLLPAPRRWGNQEISNFRYPQEAGAEETEGKCLPTQP